MRKFGVFILLVCCGAIFENLHAARPMNTDDGRVVDVNSCQLETWNRFGSEPEYWALPSCNFFLNTEITLGGNISTQKGDDSAAFVAQVKTIFGDLDGESNMGWGFAVGNASANNAKFRRDDVRNEPYGYALFSRAFLDKRMFFHSNLGYTHGDIYTAGVGVEYDMNEWIWIMGEMFYGDKIDKASEMAKRLVYQLGFRLWLQKDRLQIDFTYGNDLIKPAGRQNAYASIGLRFLTNPFFDGKNPFFRRGLKRF